MVWVWLYRYSCQAYLFNYERDCVESIGKQEKLRNWGTGCDRERFSQGAGVAGRLKLAPVSAGKSGSYATVVRF